jgi:hypothetical protein
VNTIAAGAERAVPAELPEPGVRTAPPPAVPRIHRARWTILGVLLAGAATVLMVTLGPLRPAVSALGHMRWEFLPALILLCLLHYVFSAIALRGAADRPLPLVATTLAQFTASAANRITPGGLGAAAVNTRYLVCRGLPLPRAAVAVAVNVSRRSPRLMSMAAAIGASPCMG